MKYKDKTTKKGSLLPLTIAPPDWHSIWIKFMKKPIKIGTLTIGTKPLIAGVITGSVDSKIVGKAVKDGTDMLEIRVDTFSQKVLKNAKNELKTAKKLSKKPILLTVRSAKEGSKKDLSPKLREELFKELIPFSDIIDIELSSKTILKNVIKEAKKHKKKVIISYHNFDKTPSKSVLEKIVKDGFSAGAHIVKIAAKADNLKDIQRLTNVVTDNDNIIVIAMGDKRSQATRLFFPLLGSMITYGTASRQKTAPGQLSVKELKTFFKQYS